MDQLPHDGLDVKMTSTAAAGAPSMKHQLLAAAYRSAIAGRQTNLPDVQRRLHMSGGLVSPAAWGCTEHHRSTEPRTGHSGAPSDWAPCGPCSGFGTNAATGVAGCRSIARGTPVATPQCRQPAKTVIPLILLLVAAVLLYMFLSRLAHGERSAIGLSKEEVVSADDSATRMPTLRSKRYGLVGRPDQIVRVGRVLIPRRTEAKGAAHAAVTCPPVSRTVFACARSLRGSTAIRTAGP
jgi:hypothetical protein